MNDLISVVVPAFNIDKYIERCIKSILNQTYSNLEIIIVDDGSTDNTANIIDEYALKDYRIIPIHKENGGVSSARMEGIHRASGDWIGFVDGDDVIETNMYEVLMNNAIKYNADISHCGYQMVFPDRHILKFHGTGKKINANTEEGLYNLLKADYVEPGLCNKLYKKSLFEGFENSDLWDCNIKYNEDLLMNYILFKKTKKSYYEDLVLYNYILRKNSATKSNPNIKSINDPLKVITIIKNDIQDCITKDIAYERYIRILINNSIQDFFKEESWMSKDILKKEIKSMSLFKECKSKKVILMAIYVAYFTKIYKLIKQIYYRITNVDKKYNVE